MKTETPGTKMNRKIRLLVVDFDGTALGGYEPYARFPDNFSAFLDRISSHGTLWATCTSWHPYIQDKVFRESKLKSRPVRLLGGTGLYCGVYSENRLYLDAEWDVEMISLKSDFGNNYAAKIKDFLKGSRQLEGFIEYEEHIFGIKSKGGKSLKKILGSCELFKNTYILYSSDGTGGQIFPYYMSKGAAVNKIQKQLGILPENTIAAGDGTNDLSMMQKSVASYQIAPANADPQVKRVIRRNRGIVSSLLYSDGVVDAGRKILGI